MSLLKDNFMNPQNIGKIRNSKNIGKSKSGFCGDTIETYLTIENGIIKDAKYQACGCWALIGSASIFSEYIKNKKVDDINNMSDKEYISLLGDVPEEKINCTLVTKKGFLDAI